MEARRKILLVGWQGADWKVILPLLDGGKLPHLNRLIEGGVIGKLTGVQPPGVPMAWTSLATGKYPHQHRILGTVEPAPSGDGVRPVTCLGRQGKALWNILGQHGHACQVIGWPATHPAEPLRDGVVITNHFGKWIPGSSPQQEWPLLDGVVYPDRLVAPLAELRRHPGELNGVHLLPFVPKLAEMEVADDPRLRRLASLLAESASLHAAAEYCLTHERWDFHAVRYPAIHEISAQFMNYRPPRPAFVSEEDFEMYRHVVEGAYLFHDQLLGRLVELAGEETTVMVVSDQGVHSGEFRHNAPLDEPGAPPERNEVGMFVTRGPGLKKDHLVFGGSILAIVPSLLHHLGLPVGRDMDGKVLQDLFEARQSIAWVDSWDEESANDGRHPADLRYDPFAIGFEGGEDSLRPRGECAARAALVELRSNRAESLMAARQEGEAILELEAAWKDDPGESRYAYKLMICYLALERPELARRCFERLLREKKRHAPRAREAWAALDAKDSATLLPWEKALKLKLWKQSRTNLSGMAFLQAWLLHGEGRHEEALRVAAAADENKIYNRIGLVKLQGDCFAKLKRWEEAAAAYEKVLDLDPDDPDAFLGLAKINYDQERFEDAAANAQAAVALRYFNPAAHYVYAAAIYRCGKPHAAADALKVSVKQSPLLLGAYQRLILLYNGPLRKPRVAGHWAERLDRARREKLAFEASRRSHLEQVPTQEEAGAIQA